MHAVSLDPDTVPHDKDALLRSWAVEALRFTETELEEAEAALRQDDSPPVRERLERARRRAEVATRAAQVLLQTLLSDPALTGRRG